MNPHHSTHWIAVTLAASLALLAFEAAGQSTGAQAVFEGRPAMSGAQAGQGALAGPPQGGIGLQGTDGAQVNLRRPNAGVAGAAPAAALPQCAGPTVAAADNPSCLPPADGGRLEDRKARLGVTDTQPR